MVFEIRHFALEVGYFARVMHNSNTNFRYLDTQLVNFVRQVINRFGKVINSFLKYTKA